MARIRTHILTNQPSEHKSNALHCLAMAPPPPITHSRMELYPWFTVPLTLEKYHSTPHLFHDYSTWVFIYLPFFLLLNSPFRSL